MPCPMSAVRMIGASAVAKALAWAESTARTIVAVTRRTVPTGILTIMASFAPRAREFFTIPERGKHARRMQTRIVDANRRLHSEPRSLSEIGIYQQLAVMSSLRAYCAILATISGARETAGT